MQYIVPFLSILLPLYALIPLGFIGGKILRIDTASISTLLIYFIAPIVVFKGVVETEITLGTLSIPIIVFLVCCSISLIMLYISKLFWRDSTRNVLASAAGSANTGYFAVPIALALFGNDVLGIVALTIVGTALFANTFGYYVIAKGKYTTKESVIKLLKLPIVYALLLGLVLNAGGVALPEWFTNISDNFTGAFIILGMMLIGIALSDIKKLTFDIRYHLLSILAKFILWPALMILLLYLDSLTWNLYSDEVTTILLLVSICPIAVNTAMFATLLKVQPDKVSVDVLISTMFALVYIPAVLYFIL